jgi:hypothetical protein
MERNRGEEGKEMVEKERSDEDEGGADTIGGRRWGFLAEV